MTILLDMHHVGQRQTGNETWIRNVAQHLVPRLDDALIALGPYAPAEFMPDVARVPVSGSSVRRLLVDLPRELRRASVDALLVQYTAPLSSVPSVVAIHDLSFEDPRAREWLSPKTILRYRATIRMSARRAAHIIALSEATRRDLVHYYGISESRISVAHAAVDFEMFNRAADHERVPGRVLAVGNLLPRKNVGIVAEALARLRARHPHAHLRVVGTVPEQSKGLAAQMRCLLGDEGVSFTGHVTDEQLVEEYARASVFAYPSLYEGFGLPILEALAAGLPVLCSDSSSLPEVVGDAGALLSQTDVEEWVHALDVALEPGPPDPASIARGYEQCRKFSWEQTAAIIAGPLQEAAGLSDR